MPWGCVSCVYYDLGHFFQIVLPFIEPIFSLWLQKGRDIPIIPLQIVIIVIHKKPKANQGVRTYLFHARSLSELI